MLCLCFPQDSFTHTYACTHNILTPWDTVRAHPSLAGNLQMNSWWNSDVFKKKKFQNPTFISWVIDGTISIKIWLSWLLTNYQGQLSHSYWWGPSNNSGNNGRILELFFFKHTRILPQIHCHHLQLNSRSVEASGEMATLGVNISPKWNSQNRSMVFLGSPEGP